MEKATEEIYTKVMSQGFIPLPQIEEGDGEWVNDEKDYLSPDFWQALGKAMGWGIEGHNWSTGGDRCDYCGAWDDDMTARGAYDDCWKYHWHRFIDHLAEGKDAESFFEELVK